MDKFFKISERGSSFRAEIVGGVTTFFAMAYIIFVNPGLLSQTGMDFNAVLLATCISASIGTALTGLMANVPFAKWFKWVFPKVLCFIALACVIVFLLTVTGWTGTV